MTETAAKPQREIVIEHEVPEGFEPLQDPRVTRERLVAKLRLILSKRRLLLRVAVGGLATSTLVAFLIPKSYTSTAQLMPPDPQPNQAMTMMAAMAAKAAGGLGAMAGDLMGVKSSGAVFMGVLRSETSQDRLIQQFELRKVYGKRLVVDARTKLDENTAISEDKKSGIITINVTDHSPQRAAALANAYVDQLNSLVAELSTSAAHRERVFLEDRLKVVKQNLDDATSELAQFSSKNNTLDIQQEGQAIVGAAARLAGEMIAAQSQLEGLRQIYTDSNPRVRSLHARVAELRRELERMEGTKGSTAKEADQSVEHSADLPYPSLHNFPLLGAKYANYYRRAKIQETVYGLLTEQYELAKVQEAKETPSVKILDPGKIPEKKSFPPRLLIIIFGTVLVFASSVIWILGSARWDEVDPQDPRKVFANEIVDTLKAWTPLGSGNGDTPAVSSQDIEDGLHNRRPPKSVPFDRQSDSK